MKINHAIPGFKFINNSRFEIKMADDTTVFTVRNILTEIVKSSSVFGIVMNKHKTEGIWLVNDNPRNLVGDIKYTHKNDHCPK